MKTKLATAIAFVLLAGCVARSAIKTAGGLGVECTADAECASGLCRGEGQRYCSQLCEDDGGCASADAGFCCELLGGQGVCLRNRNQTCRAAKLGMACGGVGDPLCARAGLECVRTKDVFACTKPCASADDCAGLVGGACEQIGDRQLCVPPDLRNLPRRESNCTGDAACSGDDVCQVFKDNDIDPRGVVTQCSSLRYGNLPAGQPCEAGEECDRGFCIEGFCSAPCANDAWCEPDSYCRSLTVVARADDPDTGVNEQIFDTLTMCRKRQGSEQSCSGECLAPECSTPSCPAGESCRRRVGYDGTSVLACQTFPTDAKLPFDTGLRVGSQCSITTARGLDGTRVRQPIDGRVKICASEACFAPGYCGAPCQSKSDCPSTDYSGAAMTCVYIPFQQTCARVDFNPGSAIGAECSGASVFAADNTCASLYCNSSTGRCSARKPSGSTCSRADECEALVCQAGRCLQPCRDNDECSEGECLALPVRIDPRSTPRDLSDDRFDLPTFCQVVPGGQTVTRGVTYQTCTDDSDCPGRVCRLHFALDGSPIGLCATPATNTLVFGQACTANTQCASSLCMDGACSLPCRDDSQCGDGAHCDRATLLRRFATPVCRRSNKAPAGGTCNAHADCKSQVCEAGTCLASCSQLAVAYVSSSPNDARVARCVPKPLSVDNRDTDASFDDRFDYALFSQVTRLCVADSECLVGEACVFRPYSDVDQAATASSELRGHCESPNGLLPPGAACHGAGACASGLCVNGRCAQPCATSDDCSAEEACVNQPAQLLELRGVTRQVHVCSTNL